MILIKIFQKSLLCYRTLGVSHLKFKFVYFFLAHLVASQLSSKYIFCLRSDNHKEITIHFDHAHQLFFYISELKIKIQEFFFSGDANSSFMVVDRSKLNIEDIFMFLLVCKKATIKFHKQP